jgi:arylsulfatase A-like enzyme
MGKVTPSTVCQQPTNNVDFYPTFLDIIGIKTVPKHLLDGASILPLFTDPDAHLERDALYWHYPLDKPHFLGGGSSGAIRQGDFKLIEFYDTGEVELYNVAEDVSERNNLADIHIEKVTELRILLARWRNEVGAGDLCL